MRHAVSAIRYTPANATDLDPATFVVVMDAVAGSAGVESM